MSIFSTGTSSTDFHRDTRGPQMWGLLLSYNQVCNWSSCPLRSHLINIYLSHVATYLWPIHICPLCPRKTHIRTQPTASPKCVSILGTVLMGPDKYISPLFYSPITDADDKRSWVLVTSDHMKAEVSRCLVEGKSLTVLQAVTGEVCEEGTVSGSYALQDDSWAHWLDTSLYFHYAFQACRVDWLHIRNASIAKQGKALSCHWGNYWRTRKRGDTRINAFPHYKAVLKDKVSVRQAKAHI